MLKRKIYNNVIDILFVFMYIFAFPIISIIDSSKLVGVLMLLYFLYSTKYRNSILHLLKQKKILIINVLFLLVVAWIFLIQILNSTYDFSFLKTFFNLYITIIVGFFLIVYLKNKRKSTELVNLVIIVFVIQTVIQWLCFFSKDFYMLTSLFRSESLKENYIKYTGIRGLTISSTGFFGMASAYGFVLVLYVTDYNTLFTSRYKKIFTFLLLSSGIFFTGRTGYIGFAISMIYLMLNKLKINIRKKTIKTIIFTFFAAFMCSVFIISTKNNENFSILYHYTFEPFENLMSGKGFSATSLDSLKNMYVPINGKTYFIGDGLYNTNEGYYMKTDVGYLRDILYFGVPGLIMLFILQLKLFLYKNEKIVYYICIYFLVLQFKGEIIGFSIIMQSILLFYSFCTKKRRKNNDNCIDDCL